eukprot:COSAG02_NODE_1574_length_11880_cov_13.431675_5_plen_157_part_00
MPRESPHRERHQSSGTVGQRHGNPYQVVQVLPFQCHSHETKAQRTQERAEDAGKTWPFLVVDVSEEQRRDGRHSQRDRVQRLGELQLLWARVDGIGAGIEAEHEPGSRSLCPVVLAVRRKQTCTLHFQQHLSMSYGVVKVAGSAAAQDRRRTTPSR